MGWSVELEAVCETIASRSTSVGGQTWISDWSALAFSALFSPLSGLTAFAINISVCWVACFQVCLTSITFPDDGFNMRVPTAQGWFLMSVMAFVCCYSSNLTAWAIKLSEVRNVSWPASLFSYICCGDGAFALELNNGTDELATKVQWPYLG